MFSLVLCDSLLCAHKSAGVMLHSLHDEGDVLQACLCIASGGALLMSGGQHSRDSAIGLAIRALDGAIPLANRQLGRDPSVNVIVIRAERSTAKCRENREQFPRIVKDREKCGLVKSFETPWTICDLEDVVQQRPNRKRMRVIETCELRHQAGIYGQKGDDLHFRKDIAFAAGDELIKAARRSALALHADSLKEGSILLVLAAGWNADGYTFDELDGDGHAWRKAELVALAELCALNGHRLSAFVSKMRDLLRRADMSHQSFLGQSIFSISPISPRGRELVRGTGSSGSFLDTWLHDQRSENFQRSETTPMKRKHEVAFFAEMMQVPLEVAEAQLASASGDVEAAMNSSVQEKDRSHRFARPLREATCIEILDESDVEDVGDHGSFPDLFSQLVQMGFQETKARNAIEAGAGNIERAIEMLCMA